MDRFILPDSLIPGLLHLVQSYRYARDAAVDPWQFAVELATLQEAGVTFTDLRWLLHKGWIQHQQEVTLRGAPQRQFQPLAPTQWPSRACIVLTEHGYRELDSSLHNRPEPSAADVVGFNLPPAWTPSADPPALQLNPPPASRPASKALPRWDPTLRELRYQGQLVKRFRVPAPNQELVLNAFQDEGWPEWIEDPQAPVPGVDPVQRLLATVKSLNRNQIAPALIFHCQTSAGIVSWSAPDCRLDVRGVPAPTG